MNTLTKIALGLIGQLKPTPLEFDVSKSIHLPTPVTTGGMPLMQALAARQSQRDFQATLLPQQTLSDLLWAAAGVNRAALGGRTTPSAMNAQEVDLYAALATGLYRYEPSVHMLHLVAAIDVRRVTGYQDFVDTAPLDLVYVADHGRMKTIPATHRESYASIAAGAMAQNVYLYCASTGLATVMRAWFDRTALGQSMGLDADQQILLTQTVGMPNAPAGT
ncbi:MAG: SagB/ThcOx family dehydrogenase [Burkholderiaceae bacterium]|nr:SagB/ThcOx family dehydrogenase [Burkholderiaceae bacterium]